MRIDESDFDPGQRNRIFRDQHRQYLRPGVRDGVQHLYDRLPGDPDRPLLWNDGTCEGIDYPDLRAFTVQFHPEACTGPKDTSFLFDRFVAMMKGGER